jgi:hypothetical protein
VIDQPTRPRSGHAVGTPSVATSLARLARRYSDLSLEERAAVRYLVGMWGKDDGANEP